MGKGNRTDINVRGAATLPVPVGRLHLTWPFVVMRVDTNELELRIVTRPLRTLADRLGGVVGPALKGDRLTWTCTWGDLETALLAPRKVVLCPRAGRGCRFVTIRRKDLTSIAQQLSAHNVPTQRISRFSRAGFAV